MRWFSSCSPWRWNLWMFQRSVQGNRLNAQWKLSRWRRGRRILKLCPRRLPAAGASMDSFEGTFGQPLNSSYIAMRVARWMWRCIEENVISWRRAEYGSLLKPFKHRVARHWIRSTSVVSFGDRCLNCVDEMRTHHGQNHCRDQYWKSSTHHREGSSDTRKSLFILHDGLKDS